MVDRDFEHVTHFPVKLWDVVDDDSSDIFTWSSDGLSFYVDDNKYEQEIMDKYPGFVQISSFANLRRLLREYSFDWQNNESGEFQFSHPSFKRGSRDEILNIRTKRKAIQAAIGQHAKPRRRNCRNGQGSADKSKTWMQPIPPSGKVNLRVDTLLRFPEKFWAVVNDANDMLYWGENGDTIIVDDKKYEEGIMTKYPGFVQINSFANLRRLLREYGFSWSICDNGFFEFSHIYMKKDRPELLKGVKTKRRAMRAGAHHPYLPFIRSDANYQQHSQPGAKNFQNGDPFEHFEPEFAPRSSPEMDQAVGSIQHPTTTADGRHFHHYHHHSGGDHASSLMPPQVYGLHPYRMMPGYCSTMPTTVHGLTTTQNAWGAQPPVPEKIEPPFYYPPWNPESQLRLPIPPCGSQSFDQTQTSPDGDTAGPNNEMRISSASSNESVYASSSSKDSPSDVFRQDQADISSQESSPSSFPMMTLQSSSEEGYSAANHSPNNCLPPMAQPSCVGCDIYPTPVNSFRSLDAPINLKNESACETTSPAQFTASCCQLDDVKVSVPTASLPPELNNNEDKPDLNVFENARMMIGCDECPRPSISNGDCIGSDISYHHVKKLRGYKHSDSIKFSA